MLCSFDSMLSKDVLNKTQPPRNRSENAGKSIKKCELTQVENALRSLLLLQKLRGEEYHHLLVNK